MTPDRSEYRPPKAANTKGVDNRIVENSIDTVKIWRILIKSAKRTNDNSPAVHCWVRSSVQVYKHVKRATEIANLITTKHLFRHLRGMRIIGRLSPSDKSLGYFRPSASRTRLQLSSVRMTVCYTFSLLIKPNLLSGTRNIPSNGTETSTITSKMS